MGIEINQNLQRVHLFTKNSSYVIETFEGELLHSYWGKRIALPDYSPIVPIDSAPSFSPTPNKENKTYSLDVIPREYPDYGRSDYRCPAYQFGLEDGTGVTKFVYTGMQKQPGKGELPGLPACYQEAEGEFETLVISLEDQKTNVSLKLYYCVSEKYDVITRYCQVQNHGEDNVSIDRLFSASVDFYNDNQFDVIHFPGSWARERHFSREKAGHSKHVVDSKRGASGHQENPLMLIAREDTTEQHGEVYGMNLVYSGNFKATVEVSPYNSLRMQMGMNDFGFRWQLKPGESFYSPEAVMVYSNQGFNGLSGTFHQLYKERLLRGTYRDRVRPILINNWEATYFDFDEEKLLEIGKLAKEIGIELFVLDDGWFGKRDSDDSSLGDWFVDRRKLPNGLSGAANKINALGLKFGLWFEPEMISPVSELFEQHPDWCIQVEGHSLTEARNQLILDFSKKPVQDYIIEVVGNILENNPISYVKWDMNRNMTEVGSDALPPEQQGEVMHRYMLGLYRVLETLTHRFDKILFESCSGGGGRFDPGMLYYMPQVWTSDDTDAYERMFIQYGTSFAYPQVAMGAHVSMTPNHQVGRSTPLQTRAQMAMSGNLGYELDLCKLPDETLQKSKEHIAFYKHVRTHLQFGRYYRLLSPYQSGMSAVLIEAPDQTKYYLFIYFGLNKPNQNKIRIPTVYLKNGCYVVESVDFKQQEEGPVLDSSFLNEYGYVCDLQQEDFESHLVVFSRA